MWISFEILFLTATTLLLSFVYLVIGRSKKSKSPPLKTGFVPWLGCAIEFGKEPLNVIRRTQLELGDLFTIHAAGKYMTFITQPEDFGYFFQNKNADFRAAVQPYTRRTAGIPYKAFTDHHTSLHDAIKSSFIPASLSDMVPRLGRRFSEVLDSYEEEGEMDLVEFVRIAMFTAVVKEIFGENCVPASIEEMMEFKEHFFKYDADFEYGAELPEYLLRGWKGHKYWLLDFFRSAVSSLKKENSTGEDERRETLFKLTTEAVGEHLAPNFALLLLWASQANAVPAVFWTLAFILDSPVATKTILSEIKAANTASPGHGYSESWLKLCPSVKRCVLEAVRLRSPGIITRKVVKGFSIRGHVIPEGHFLMLSPYWTHQNHKFFPEPDKFNPDRWNACDIDKFQFLDGFVGFGGGRYQCPGRWFALMEMHLFVTIVMSKFELQLMDGVPEPSPLHVIGSQQPARKCFVKFKKRN